MVTITLSSKKINFQGSSGYLKYQDTSTGQLVSELRSGLGSCNTLVKNSQNGILHLGHLNGVVTLWSPMQSKPLVKMFCHKGPVKALAIDNSGTYMVSTGLDSQMKIWDVRTFKPVSEYFLRSPGVSVDISQSGMVGVGYGTHVNIWKGAFGREKMQAPYMR